MSTIGLFSCGENQDEPENLYEQNLKYEENNLNYSKSSFGYTQNEQNGYNGWYFLDSFKNELLYKKDRFVNLDNKNHYLRNGYIKGNIILKYLVYKDGTIGIYANVNKALNLKIFKNDCLIESGKYEMNDYLNLSEISVSKKDVLYFEIQANEEVYFNPIIDYNTKELNYLHYKSKVETPNSYIGDVHPFYDEVNKNMINYYLSADGTFLSRGIQSQNFITYFDNGAKRTVDNQPLTTGFATKVVKVNDEYFSFYGSYDKFVATKSLDLINWSEKETINDDFLRVNIAEVDYNFVNGRDPYCFYDEQLKKYRLLSLQYYPPNSPYHSALVLQTFDKDINRIEHDKTKVIYRNKNKNQDFEVPQFIRIGNYWYLTFSTYGKTDHGVGAFTYIKGNKNQKIDETNWENGEVVNLTSEDLCAAQIEKVGERYYINGWIPQDAYGNQWGGTLNLPLQVIQDKNGNLFTKYDQKFLDKINNGLLKTLNNFSLHENERTIASNLNRVYVNGKINLVDGFSRLIFENSNKKRITINFSKKNNSIFIRDDVKVLSSFNNLDLNSIYFNLIIEEDTIELNINDMYTLHARIKENLNDFKLLAYSNTSSNVFESIQVFRLGNYKTIN